MRRLRDILIATLLLLLTSPILLMASILVWAQDWHSPFYISTRVGKDGKLFSMVKLRSMIANADASGVDSTGEHDTRITPIGKVIRRYKLDEITQMWNVLLGDMSLVGPRPNVQRETNLYSDEEKKLLIVRPGITDFSSIIFSDEGDILENKEDPDIAYNQLIRPWKSRLGIIYINNSNFLLDLKIIFYTFILIFNRRQAINWVVNRLQIIGCSSKIIKVCHRVDVLSPYPPPGFKEIVTKR